MLINRCTEAGFAVSAALALLTLVCGRIPGTEVRSAAPEVLALITMAIVRVARSPSSPFIFTSVSPLQLGLKVRSAFRSALDERSELASKWSVLGLLCLASFGLRAANAWAYRGFYSGDDVETLEWVISRVQGWGYTPWELRNAFFPFGFIFPPVWAAHAIGLTGTWHLVFVGRLVVALWSTLGVVFGYLIARRLATGVPGALIVAGWAAFGGISIRFSSGVFSRPVAGTLLVAGLWQLLARKGRWQAAAAGVLVGLAAATRFSEGTFLVAGAAVLAFERRWRALLAFVLVGGLTAGLALAGSDLVARGDPLASTRAVVGFTLLRGASTRGFQPWYYYLGDLVQVVTPLGLIFLVRTIRRAHAELWIWCGTPMVLLSLLPHKEMRYLVAVLPALLVMVGLGVLVAASDLRSRWDPGGRSHWRSPAIVAALAVGLLLLQLDAARFERSSAPVDAAMWIASHWAGQRIALEQAWRAGDRLYLPKAASVHDLEPPLDATPCGSLADVLADPDVGFVGLRSATAREDEVTSALTGAGFLEVRAVPAIGPDYALFVRPAVAVGAPRPGRGCVE